MFYVRCGDKRGDVKGWCGESIGRCRGQCWGRGRSWQETCLYNFDPFKPDFYLVKVGFTGVCIIFLILLKIIDCGYSLEPPQWGGSNEYHNLCFEHWGGSNEYPQSMILSKYMKKTDFLSENFQVLVVKFSIYLNRRVFVMWHPESCLDSVSVNNYQSVPTKIMSVNFGKMAIWFKRRYRMLTDGRQSVV